ncbi:MAG: hypothetical protein P8182_13015 [Deltaproteobacteria bacterium]
MITLVLSLLLIGSGAASAIAWEFAMRGEWENRFRWFSRIGNNDLFGMAAAQDTAVNAMLVGMAGPNIFNTGVLPTVAAPTSNFWLNLGSATGRQMLITRGGFSASASDANVNDSRLTLRPMIEINPVIRIRGVLNIGGYRNKYSQDSSSGEVTMGVPPLERYYAAQSSTNAHDTLALISVEQIWSTTQTPWGIISVGARAFPFGTGATFGENTRSEMYLLAVPYGPFRFMLAFWPGSMWIPSIWSNVPDAALRNTSFQAFFLTFDHSLFSIGAGTMFRQYHADNVVAFAPNQDDEMLINLVYVKYNDGRFFANAEGAWMNIDRRLAVAPNPAGGGIPSASQTQYIEGMHFFAEAGAILGRMKLSLMYALASGPVLNTENRVRNIYAGGFFLGDATPAPFQPGANPKVYTPWAINYQVMEPYEFLMFQTYAGGNNGGWNAMDFTFVADDHGMMTDAYCFAGRLDCAIASNLDLWVSYIWAHRLERAGTYFGEYQSSGSLAAGSIPNLQRFYANDGRSFGTGNDYVSNGFIGWEMDCGTHWKLLENLIFQARYSYWQPGDWFKEAYQAVVVTPGGVAENAGVLHSRDPIQAVQTSMLIEF